MANELNESYAALDLGSNSFHLIVANYVNGRIQIVDRIKKMIRLASGLDEIDNLSEDSMTSALVCLEEFAQRIREIPKKNIRAVGTNTLRQAKNGRHFVSNARKALGHPIEVISGREEARLIYLGVANTVYDGSNRRMVIDIGGGSTEIIIGKGFDVYKMESFYVGCVSMTRKFFGTDNITKKNLNNAILNVRQELEAVEASFEKFGWDKAIGSSGTILAINNIVKNKAWSANGISTESLMRLKDAIITAGKIDKIELPGLSTNRKPVFIGGLAVLIGIFETFELDHMDVSDGALREGLLYDLIGRHHDQDIRDRSIEDLATRYHLDNEQALRVCKSAVGLFQQVSSDWQLDVQEDLKILKWAGLIHEIGLAIAHAQYHYHGAYLLANSDLAGFSREEQGNVALLVRCHRRKFPLNEIQQLPDENRDRLIRLCILLRLAVLLSRGHSYVSPPNITVTVTENSILLKFADHWLNEHPLTKTDLEQEADYIRTVGYRLKYLSETE
jgi:exopolyphosphatase/guanosine-5'-triphosphate,3'-diphosphate pyrophosphatase